jgi:hypothetical protein
VTRIICPGMGRTGTTTLGDCLNILGFNNQPVAGDWYWVRLDGERVVFNPDRESGDRFQAYTDSPIPLVYQELLDLYPGSRVILTTRPLDGWLKSIEGHIAWSLTEFNETKRGEAGRLVQLYHRQVYGSERFDRDAYARHYDAHNAAVREVMRSRPEPFVEIDLTQKPRWEPLCEFLEIPIPDELFPWRNRSSSRGPERVNDFATPVDVNLVCGRRVYWWVFSPRVAG